MNNDLPHTEEPIAGENTSTQLMRSWMDQVKTCLDLMPDLEVIDDDFTVSAPAILLCTNTSPITITLPVVNKQQIIIKRLGDLVSFAGTIDGNPSETLAALYDRVHIIGSESTSEYHKI